VSENEGTTKPMDEEDDATEPTSEACSPSDDDAVSADEFDEDMDDSMLDIQEPPAVDDPTAESAPADAGSDVEIELELTREKLRVKTDQLVRLAADFDNFKKRSRRDLEREQASFAERLFRKLLPTLDSMDRAKQSVEDGDDLEHLRDGLTQIHSLFWAALAEVGVTPMDCVGQPFDPRFHEALMHHPSPGAAPNSITVELQKGWVLGDRVLRAARVGVAPDTPAATDDTPEEPAADEGVAIDEAALPPEEPLMDEAKEVVDAADETAEDGPVDDEESED